MKSSPVYDKNTLEFVTVALEYCSLIEMQAGMEPDDYVDRMTKLLPLFYLKAALLPDVEEPDDVYPELIVTEEIYESIRERIALLLGEKDSFLDTFHPDMPYSDTPVVAFISECLADVYQDAGNFVELFRQGNEAIMQAAMAICKKNFREFWGQRLLNALKALHAVRYEEEDDFEETNKN